MTGAIRRPRRPSRQHITLQLGQHALGSPSDRAYGQMNARIEHALDGQSMGGVHISCLLKPTFVHKRPQFFSRTTVLIETRDFIRFSRIGDFHARTSSHLNRRPTCKRELRQQRRIARVHNPSPFWQVKAIREKIPLDNRPKRRYRHAPDKHILCRIRHMVVVARLAFIEIEKGRSTGGKTGHGAPMYIVANSLKRLQGVLDRGMPCLLAHILLRKSADELRGVLSLFDRVPNVGVRGRFPCRRKQEAVIA